MKYPEAQRLIRIEKKKRSKRKYPFAFPGLTPDIYFPFSNIPRPIHKDLRDYPNTSVSKRRNPGTSKRKNSNRKEAENHPIPWGEPHHP